MPRLVLGTRNQHKVQELLDLLQPLGVQVESLSAYPQAIEVEEDGHTFAENAAKKAVQQARHLGRWVLAEDSGLEVDALAGRPGVHSARYSDPGATDERNNDKLLAELGDLSLPQRTARYVCHAVLADPQGEVRAEALGFCRGRILFDRHGRHGFGYDPLFQIAEYHRTFGELGPAVKAVLSHRSRAMQALVPQVQSLLAAGDWR